MNAATSRCGGTTRSVVPCEPVNVNMTDSIPETWVVPSKVTTHSGKPIPDRMDFFEPPPKEIGDILTAHSTLKKHQRPMGLPLRIILSILAGLFAAAFAVLGVVLAGRTDFLGLAIIGVVFLIVAGLALYSVRFRHDATYVGCLGVARIRCLDDRHKIVRRDVLVFSKEMKLRYLVLDIGPKMILAPTTISYDFQWINGQGERLFRHKGRYNSEIPRTQVNYDFGLMAAASWNTFIGDEEGDDDDDS